jgi:hypothetical protein
MDGFIGGEVKVVGNAARRGLDAAGKSRRGYEQEGR